MAKRWNPGQYAWAVDYTRVTSHTRLLATGEQLTWLMIEDVLHDGGVTSTEVTDGRLDGASIPKRRLEELLAEA